MPAGKPPTRTRRRAAETWPSRTAPAIAALLLLASGSCSQKPPSPVLDTAKVGSVVVGHSSRSEVLAVMGRPSRTERSAAGEAWVYESKTDDSGGQSLMSGASAATGVIGAFVPYAGLVGSGLGLAGTAANGTRSDPQAVSLTVMFRDDGIVRDCSYSTTAAPTSAKPIDCQRPLAVAP